MPRHQHSHHRRPPSIIFAMGTAKCKKSSDAFVQMRKGTLCFGFYLSISICEMAFSGETRFRLASVRRGVAKIPFNSNSLAFSVEQMDWTRPSCLHANTVGNNLFIFIVVPQQSEKWKTCLAHVALLFDSEFSIRMILLQIKTDWNEDRAALVGRLVGRFATFIENKKEFVRLNFGTISN